MQKPFIPLRWESTGDQWWYASPIDWAAANGQYDIVRELLHLDTNLLIKLTSLRRIRRLETVWDDDASFADAAKCRAFVARNLLCESEMRGGKNSLIRAGYGGWLLYTAASAGDLSFVQELLQREPLLVFGEGEYGVTDILYAAARSKNSEVFKLIFDSALSPRCSESGVPGNSEEGSVGTDPEFRFEMMNRSVHAAARGGNLDVLKDLLDGCLDVLAYQDLQGSTILHAAAGKGQVEVIKYLLEYPDIINSSDNQGNTALHVAAFRGHAPVVKALLIAHPLSSASTNNAGDTFLHMAVLGFRTPGFRRLDKQMELIKQLVNGDFVNVKEIINFRNSDGRTALHLAVVGNFHSDLVELLMTVRSIDLNIRDAEGMTPLDLLRQHPRSASSEILIKQLIAAGGISNSNDRLARSAIALQLKMQGIVHSPGTSFRISDAEIFLHTGIEASETSGKLSPCLSTKSDFITGKTEFSDKKKDSPMKVAANRLKYLLRWASKRENKSDIEKVKDDVSLNSIKKWMDHDEIPTPLRQRYSRGTSILNNKRTLAHQHSLPSPSTKMKFSAGLRHGVIRPLSHLHPSEQSPSRNMSRSYTLGLDERSNGNDDASCSVVNGRTANDTTQKPGLINTKLMNQYLCFGAQGLAADDSVHEYKPNGKSEPLTKS